jgi:hypothetical protein
MMGQGNIRRNFINSLVVIGSSRQLNGNASFSTASMALILIHKPSK